MASKKQGLSDRRLFLARAGGAAASVAAGIVLPPQALGSALSTQIQPDRGTTTVWLLDFLTASGRIIKPFAREEDAKWYATSLITREMEDGHVREPDSVSRRMAAYDLDGAIAAYQEDQRRTFRGGEVRIFAERLARMAAPVQGPGSDPATQAQPDGGIATVWIVDFLAATGRIIKPFAREEDAKRYAASLIAREIEQGYVRDSDSISRQIAADDLDAAIAAYQEDQRTHFRGGEVRVFEEPVADLE